MAIPFHGPLTGNSMLNGVLWDGWKWIDGATPLQLNYFFSNDAGQGWLAVEKTAYQTALASWASVANLNFVETNTRSLAHFVETITSQTQMNGLTGATGVFGFHDTPEFAVAAHSNTGGGVTSNLAVNQAGGYYSYQGGGLAPAGWTAAQLSSGGFFERMMIHELGHGLGLKHPHDIIGAAPKFPGVNVNSDLARIMHQTHARAA